jgi:hypothetical protein
VVDAAARSAERGAARRTEIAGPQALAMIVA